MRRAFLAVLFCLYAAPALAQTGTPTSYVLRVYVQGAALPIAPAATIPVASFQCGQPKATGSTVNPTKWRINDPANATLDCVLDDTARLNGLSDGNYEGTLAAANADGTSAETARAPFSRRRPNPPAVPSNLRITD